MKIYNDLVTQLNPIPKQAYYDTINTLYRVLTQERYETDKVTGCYSIQYEEMDENEERKYFDFVSRWFLPTPILVPANIKHSETW